MKKTTKLLLAVLVVAVLCLSLAACDNHEHTYGDWTLTTAPHTDNRRLGNANLHGLRRKGNGHRTRAYRHVGVDGYAQSRTYAHFGRQDGLHVCLRQSYR